MKHETATRQFQRHLAGTAIIGTDTFFLRTPSILARETAGSAPSHIQIFPKGPTLATVDGRIFSLTDPDSLVQRINASASPILVDYDHLSAFDPDEGGNTRAAGWIQALEVRDGEVWASVEWTTTASEAISAGEYRFISPEFLVDNKSGEVTGLAAAALVNRPAFQMTALAREDRNRKEPAMLKAIAKALGLDEDADEAAILAAITKKDEDHESELASQKSKARTPSVDDFMPRADYDRVLARAERAEQELEDSRQESFKKRVDHEIAAAVKDGKITPATAGHYKALCTDEAALEKVLAAIGKSPTLLQKSGISGKPDETETALTTLESEMAASLGVSEKDFLAAKNNQA